MLEAPGAFLRPRDNALPCSSDCCLPRIDMASGGKYAYLKENNASVTCTLLYQHNNNCSRSTLLKTPQFIMKLSLPPQYRERFASRITCFASNKPASIVGRLVTKGRTAAKPVTLLKRCKTCHTVKTTTECSMHIDTVLGVTTISLHTFGSVFQKNSALTANQTYCNTS